MRSIYNKEDDKEQLGIPNIITWIENFFKKLDDFNKHMDKGNIDNFIDKEQPNIKRTDSKKPITVKHKAYSLR